jgi:uncharacterized delta-60 repeat protein
MLQTLLTLCLTLSGKAAKRPAPRRRPAFHRPSCRPRLEALEDRCLLSAGALDPTFGNGAGYATTSLTNSNDDGFSALIQPDGKIIAVGQAETITKLRGLYQATYGVALVRYNTDGSLDTSFGNSNTGKVIGPAVGDVFIHAALYPAEGTANDGKIVVGGLSSGFAIARYNTNGTLDTSFGSNGIATAPFAATSGYHVVFEVIQPDGKIVALGQTADNTQAQLARFNPDGSLDTNFQGGMVTGPVPTPDSLLLQADGKLVMLGTTSGDTEIEMARYNADGTLDTSFGSSGIVMNSSLVEADAGAIYPIAGTANDRKIVVEGPGKSSGLELARYNPDGSLDTTFGNDGLMATPSGQITTDQQNSQGVVIQPDGRIVITADGNHFPGTFAVARYNIDGSLDSTFGSGGIVKTSIGTSYAVALQSNGAIVVAGTSSNGTQDVFIVARYLGGPTSGPAFGVTGFPSSTTAGVAQTITVTAENASGNPNTGYTGTIHFTSSDPQAALPADYTFAPGDQGVHSFNVTLKTAGFQSVNVTDLSTGYSGGDGAITINPAAASSFVVSGFPTSIIQGTAATFTVTAMDPYGNVATGYTGTVKFSSSDPLASLPGNYTFTPADAGVHTFSATLNTASTESLTVTDILDAAINGTETGISVKKKH